MSGANTAALLCGAMALELWWAVPRGYGPDGLYLQLIPLSLGVCGLCAVLLLRKRRSMMIAITVLLFFSSTLAIDALPENGLAERRNDFQAPPYVEYLKKRPGYPRIVGSYGVLFPNYAGSVGLYDIHHINALVLPGLPDFRYRFLKTPISGQDIKNPSLWFTGMPQRITIKLDNPDVGPYYKIEERAIEMDFLEHLPHYSLMGIRYLLMPAHLELSPEIAVEYANRGIELVYDAEIRIYENRGALARAFLIYPFTTDEAFNSSRSGARKNGKAALTIGTEILEQASSSTAANKSWEEFTPAKIIEYRTNSMSLETDSPRPGVLVISDAFATGWSASIDGKTEPIMKVNGFICGVFVDRGTHSIKFTYNPPGFATGVKLFFLGLTITTVLLFAGLYTRAEQKHII